MNGDNPLSEVSKAAETGVGNRGQSALSET